jgi:hypothetical protein
MVAISYPQGLKASYENATASQHTQESVLEGESVDRWAQMIILTGAKNISANPSITPELFVRQIASGFNEPIRTPLRARAQAPSRSFAYRVG